jgi:excisionase family DNA binding protein
MLICRRSAHPAAEAAGPGNSITVDAGWWHLRGQRVMSDSPEVMNIRQASEYLGVSPDTLYKYVSEDKIPAFKLGNRWKFKKALLDRWMENKSSGGEGTLKKKPRAVRTTAVG